jgi:hypothetical protein
MKKIILIVAILMLPGTAFSQPWFQSSMEYKFNTIAGLSVSNEIGYNVLNLRNWSVAPSIDYTYYSNGYSTEHLIFKCATLTYSFSTNSVVPYVSITACHLTKVMEESVPKNSLGYSGQVGVGFELTKNAQFFFQYRYFSYTTVLQGQLTQFGIMYIF